MRWSVEVHAVVCFVTSLFMELKYFIETLVIISAYQTTRCHMKMDKHVCKLWCHKATAVGTTGRSYNGELRYRQAATPVRTFTLPLPNTTTVWINLQVLQNSQNCITCEAWAGGGSPPTQQERPVPSLQTALPYPVKGGAKQIMFRSCLLSRYAVIYERDNPPSPHVLQQCICKCRSPMQFHILHPPNETFTQTYRTGSTPLIWATEPVHFLSALCSNLELRVPNLHVGMWSCTVRHGNTENFHVNSGFPFWFSFANIRISPIYVRIRKTPATEDKRLAQTQPSMPVTPQTWNYINRRLRRVENCSIRDCPSKHVIRIKYSFCVWWKNWQLSNDNC